MSLAHIISRHFGRSIGCDVVNDGCSGFVDQTIARGSLIEEPSSTTLAVAEEKGERKERKGRSRDRRGLCVLDFPSGRKGRCGKRKVSVEERGSDGGKEVSCFRGVRNAKGGAGLELRS